MYWINFINQRLSKHKYKTPLNVTFDMEITVSLL